MSRDDEIKRLDAITETELFYKKKIALLKQKLKRKKSLGIRKITDFFKGYDKGRSDALNDLYSVFPEEKKEAKEK